MGVCFLHFDTLSKFAHPWAGWFTWTQLIDQLPVGLLAQLVERSISIT